ncbi:hypothetical protein MRX96_006722 [Rhipicephalus microplus]
MVLEKAAGVGRSVRCGEHTHTHTKNAAHRPSTRSRSSQTFGSVAKQSKQDPAADDAGLKIAPPAGAPSDSLGEREKQNQPSCRESLITGGTFARTLFGLDTVPQGWSERRLDPIEEREGGIRARLCTRNCMLNRLR